VDSGRISRRTLALDLRRRTSSSSRRKEEEDMQKDDSSITRSS
jgi:hypothetical protein